MSGQYFCLSLAWQSGAGRDFCPGKKAGDYRLCRYDETKKGRNRLGYEGREDILRAESQDVVKRTFGGSLPTFLTSFMSGRTLSDAEADELKALIDQYREGKDQG